ETDNCIITLQSYVELLSAFSLRDSEQSAYLSLQTVAELSRLEPDTYNGPFTGDTPLDQIRSVPQLSFKNNKCYAGSTIPRPAQIIRDRTLDFVCYLVRTLPQAAVEQSLYILVQHVCSKIPDKAEYRAKVSQVGR
ncbi:hypothetical protein LSH36_737g05064, partial [Paralvinella palmiformis]